jgi:uncharacterized protein (TIGR00299 family) protein
MPDKMALESRPSAVILDPIGGISGDMFVAAMLDAWPALAEPVLATIRQAGLPPDVTVELVERQSDGIAAAGFIVSGGAAAPSGDYRAFRARLESADLPASVCRHALGILRLLAEAEAAVHAVPVDEVHFHELADWDTQADIVGAAAIIDLIGAASWHCRPLPPGSGTVSAAHGLLPLPAPAVAQLLTGFAFRADDGIPGERVTPTGAAILRYLGAGNGEAPAGTLVASGAGAGTRTLRGVPNILRVLGLSAAAQASETILVIEFDIDDQSPEETAIALDNLRAVAGVRDVATFQGLGKKGRWLQAVRILAEPTEREAFIDAIFRETTTLGLRMRQESRMTLRRREVVVEGDAGRTRVKVAERSSGRTAKAESDDVARHGKGAAGRARLRRSATHRALKSEE